MPTRTSSRDRLGLARPPLQVRHRRRRRRTVRVVLVLLVVLGLLVGGAWLLGWSSVLAVQRVRVEGTSLLTPDRVAEAAQVPLGRPLARVDVERIRARVATLAPVEQARVERGWPSTVRIELTERTAVLTVQTPEGRQLVDRTGLAFAPAEEEADGVVPAEVDGPAEGAEPLTEQRRRELLADLARVVRVMPPELVEQLESVRTDSPDTIELALSEDRTVEWGSAADSELKVRVLTVLLEQEGEVYNVTVPSHPSVR